MNPRFIWSFAKFNGISWIKESPWSIIANIVTPVCLVVILYLISNGRLVTYAIVGGVIAIISATTLTATGESAFFRLELRIQDLIIPTKVTMIDYVFAFTLANLVSASPGIMFFAMLSVLFHLFTLQRLLTMLAVVVLLAIAATSIAVFVGSWIKRVIGLWAISGILSAIMTLLPPTFYPYGVLPKAALYILAISPVTPAAVIMQGAYGLGAYDLWMWPLLIFEVFFYIFIVGKFGRWAEK